MNRTERKEAGRNSINGNWYARTGMFVLFDNKE